MKAQVKIITQNFGDFVGDEFEATKKQMEEIRDKLKQMSTSSYFYVICGNKEVYIPENVIVNSIAILEILGD